MNQSQETSLSILQMTGLKPVNFADLIRTAQLIYDPTGGVFGKIIHVNWQCFDIPKPVEENLKILGEKYQYASPHLESELVWRQLIPETRSWFIENKDILWQFEELFPPLDID